MTESYKLPVKSIFGFAAFCCLVSTLAPASLRAQPPCDCETYSRLIKKEYEVYPTVSVSIANKYGPVSVEGWAKNRIRVEALTEVQAENETAAAQFFERIQTEMNLQQRLVSIQTAITPLQQTWWPFPGLQMTDYSVAIRVFLPQPAAISVLNKHGRVSIKNMDGSVSAEVHSGDVFGTNLKGEVTLNQKDGALSLEQITRLNADLVNVEGSLISGGWIRVRSRSTTLKFRNVDRLESETRYDSYFVDRSGVFTNEGRFDEIALDRVREVKIRTVLSRLYLDKIRDKAEVEADSSQVRITDLPAQFRQVQLEGRFTDFRIVLPSSTSYRLRAEARHAGIRYPRTLQVTEETEASGRHIVQGYFGQRHPGVGLLEASINYGGLTIESD